MITMQTKVNIYWMMVHEHEKLENCLEKNLCKEDYGPKIYFNILE